MEITKFIQQREAELRAVLEQSQKELLNVPQGNLNATDNGKKVRFYLYDPENLERSRYLGKKSNELILQLARKEYYKKSKEYAERTIQLLDDFLLKYKSDGLAEIYGHMHPAKKKFVHPFVYPTDEFIRRWEGSRSPMKNTYEIRSEIYSNRGEQVRSKSEKIIADYLLHKGIPYKYEEALTLDGRTVYPDFTVLNKRTGQLFYWEHLGMMDDAEYSAKTMEKLTWYERNDIWPGDRLLVSWETSTMPLNMRVVEKMIRRYLV